MVLKLYGAGCSTSVLRVAAFMHEKNIPFELVHVDVAHGEHNVEKPPFGLVPYLDDDGFILYESRAICRYLEDKFPDHGPRLIPTDPKKKAVFEQAASVEVAYFDFDAFAKETVGDSETVFRQFHYLFLPEWENAELQKQGLSLTPIDPEKKGIVEQAASVEVANFDAYASKGVAEMIFEPRRGLTADQAVFDNLIVELGKRLDVYDVILSKQKYTAGDDFTLVDIFHLPYGWLLETAGSRIMYDEKRPNVVRWWKDITSRNSWQAVKDGVVGLNA